MNSEHPEYNRDKNPYPSFGKKYNSERAIISLTSWKARINTVGKTIFSLIKQCPGFHIVLVLSEEEFPKKEKELPEDLMLLSKYFEILWVYKNYKSLKKVLFTMDKYRDVPVISADDDCLYTCNYAEELYKKWLKNKLSVITGQIDNRHKYIWTRGPYTLFPPYCFKTLALDSLNKLHTYYNDDMYYAALYIKLKIELIDIHLDFNSTIVFHDEAIKQSDIYKYDLGDVEKFLTAIN